MSKRIHVVINPASGKPEPILHILNGGDGTVMEMVTGLVGTGVPLGILPGGTGNVLSIEVDIPQTSEEAAQLLVSDEAQIRHVDVGQSGQNYFLLRAFVGFDAQRIRLATRDLRDSFGKAAYIIAADPPQAAIGDGEAWGETAISLKVLPGAIPVIAPPEVQG